MKKVQRKIEEVSKKGQKARKQLQKWTHIVGAVRGESAAGDSQLNTGFSINGASL